MKRIFEFRIANTITTKARWLVDDFRIWHEDSREAPLPHHIVAIQGVINGFYALDFYDYVLWERWQGHLIKTTALAVWDPQIFGYFRQMIEANPKFYTALRSAWEGYRGAQNVLTLRMDEILRTVMYTDLAAEQLHAEP